MTETNLACAFPGQGIQKPGMTEHLVGTKAWSCFDQASELVGYDLGQLCLEGPQAALDNTAKAQVAIFVTCYALWELYKENFKPKLFLGHSLGEITALGAAGAFSFAQGVTLVKARGEAMGKASHQGGMSAIIGLDLQAVDEVCLAARDHGHVQIANRSE